MFLCGSARCNSVSYFDPFAFCYIGIDNDVLRDNQATISKALRLIQHEDRASYSTVCRYVDAIIEDYCTATDAMGEGVAAVDAAGCYVRGSKLIYVRPAKDTSEATVRGRAETITTYAERSKNFWIGVQDRQYLRVVQKKV